MALLHQPMLLCGFEQAAEESSPTLYILHIIVDNTLFLNK